MKNAKSKILCAALVSTALFCSSCGNQNDLNDSNTTVDENAPADEITTDDEQSDGVSIEINTFEDERTAEDGTVLYRRSYSQPTVTIEGNEEASEKINADIQSRIDAFMASEQMYNDAAEFYEVTQSEEDFIFHEYIESLDYSASRADTSVISFVETTYSDTGGAHGIYGGFGLNYDARTGELIKFAELSDDPDKFYNDTLAYNRELAQTDEYKERMFEEGFLGEDEFENVLYADEKWYLSNEGLVFISNPYELGPYAAGMIEFVIPYDELNEMGLKEEYSYSANP